MAASSRRSLATDGKDGGGSSRLRACSRTLCGQGLCRSRGSNDEGGLGGRASELRVTEACKLGSGHGGYGAAHAKEDRRTGTPIRQFRSVSVSDSASDSASVSASDSASVSVSVSVSVSDGGCDSFGCRDRYASNCPRSFRAVRISSTALSIRIWSRATVMSGSSGGSKFEVSTSGRRSLQSASSVLT
jgi:hypothetical protein